MNTDSNIIGKAYFKGKYMGVIINKEYNHTFKKNILTLITTANTVVRIAEPSGENWVIKKGI